MKKLLYTIITILTCTLAQSLYSMNGGAKQKKLAAQSKTKPVHIQVLEELAARPRTIEPKKPGESGTALPATIMQLINEYANPKHIYLLALMTSQQEGFITQIKHICYLTNGCIVIICNNLISIFNPRKTDIIPSIRLKKTGLSKPSAHLITINLP